MNSNSNTDAHADNDSSSEAWIALPSAGTGTGPQFTQLHVTQMKRKTKMKTTVEKRIKKREPNPKNNSQRALTVTIAAQRFSVVSVSFFLAINRNHQKRLEMKFLCSNDMIKILPTKNKFRVLLLDLAIFIVTLIFSLFTIRQHCSRHTVASDSLN